MGAKMTKQLAKNSNEAQKVLGLRDQLVGTWQLLSYVSTPKDPTEEATYPLGKNPNGILIYTADGYMSAQIQALAAKDQRDQENATKQKQQQQQQLTGYLGYTGPFYIDYDSSAPVLQHHVSLSSFPAWLGDTQRRVARLDGDILVLSTESAIIYELENHHLEITGTVMHTQLSSYLDTFTSPAPIAVAAILKLLLQIYQAVKVPTTDAVDVDLRFGLRFAPARVSSRAMYVHHCTPNDSVPFIELSTFTGREVMLFGCKYKFIYRHRRFLYAVAMIALSCRYL